MKHLALICVLFLVGCTNGNLTAYKSGESVNLGRVSECQKPTDDYMVCISRGKRLDFHALLMKWDRVTYTPNVLSDSRADFCQELGLFCGGGK